MKRTQIHDLAGSLRPCGMRSLTGPACVFRSLSRCRLRGARRRADLRFRQTPGRNPDHPAQTIRISGLADTVAQFHQVGGHRWPLGVSGQTLP